MRHQLKSRNISPERICQIARGDFSFAEAHRERIISIAKQQTISSFIIRNHPHSRSPPQEATSACTQQITQTRSSTTRPQPHRRPYHAHPHRHSLPLTGPTHIQHHDHPPRPPRTHTILQFPEHADPRPTCTPAFFLTETHSIQPTCLPPHAQPITAPPQPEPHQPPIQRPPSTKPKLTWNTPLS